MMGAAYALLLIGIVLAVGITGLAFLRDHVVTDDEPERRRYQPDEPRLGGEY